MQLFVSGTWSEEKAAPYALVAFRLGMLIAKEGYDLACGPGTGIARHVIDGYCTVQTRGTIRYYLPSFIEMEKVGEIIQPGADEIIETGLDYPMRNIYQVRASNGLFILTGGDGTLEEAICALSDYKIPVSGLKGSGTAIGALELLLGIYRDWSNLLMISDDIIYLLGHIKSLSR